MNNTENNVQAANWMYREAERFTDGEYTDLPGSVMQAMAEAGVTPEYRHFLHTSTQRPGMIAFTEDDAKGAADRQTQTKFGKYLKRYHGHLDAPTVAHLAGLLRIAVDVPTLFHADTRDDIADVYQSGPNSCMAHDADDYDTGGTHPTEVYAGPDTAIAYTKREGRITARAVVNTTTMQHVTIYGDKEALQPLLDAAGYTRGTLNGARCLYLENNNGDIIFPYVDGGADMVTVTGGYSVLGYDGDHNAARNTNGLLVSGEYCCNCEEHGFDEYDMQYVEDADGLVCEDCLDRHFVMVNGEYDGEWRHDSNLDDCIMTPVGWMTDAHFSYQDEYVLDHDGDVQDADECVYIDDECEYYHRDECVEYVDSDGDDQWLPNERIDELVVDVHTDERILLEDAVETAHGYMRA